MEPLIWVVTMGYGGSSYTVPKNALDGILDELLAAIDNELEITYTLKVHQMCLSDYEALPEFDGF